MINKLNRAIIRVILPYLAFAGLWITLSDRILEKLVADPAARVDWSIYKGLAFVLITALLLASLLRRELKARAEAYEALHRTETEMRRSRALLLSVAEGTSDAIYLKDLEGRYQMINSAACRFLGRAREEVVGRDDGALLSPEDARHIMADDRQVLESGETRVYEEQVSIGDRRCVMMSTKGPVRDSEGVIVGVFGMARDITREKEIEQALRESERKYRELVEHANSIILHWDPEGRITFLNEFGLRFFGYAPEEIIGRHVVGTIVPETDDAGRNMKDMIKQICLDPEQFGQNINQNMRRSGERVWITWNNRFLHDDEGRVTGTLSIGADITELRRAENAIRELNASLEKRVAERTAELAIARDRAEAADRIKSAFLANMSHELRTPLNSIIGFTGIILKGLAGPLNPEQQKQLEMVRASARHLLALINDILDISKIEAGQMEVRRQPFDLRDSIMRVGEIIRPFAEKKRLALSLHLGPEIGMCESDARRVEQILLNLLNNAIKFTERGSVALTAEASTESIRIAVADTGIGIGAEEVQRIFLPFTQLDAGLTRQHEGSGLGLAISRRLAELLGGTVEAASVPGEGSVFTLTLPAKGTKRQ